MSERMTDERWHEIGAYRSVEMAWDVADQMEVGAELDRARASEARLEEGMDNLASALYDLEAKHKALTFGRSLPTQVHIPDELKAAIRAIVREEIANGEALKFVRKEEAKVREHLRRTDKEAMEAKP
jgi:predicted nuclease with TOPRIM domain